MHTIIINADGSQTDERTGALLPPQPSAYHVYDVDVGAWINTRTLDSAKECAWQRIKQARAEMEHGDFVCNGAVYQANKENIACAAQRALQAHLAGEPFSVDWTLSDNSIATLDATGMLAVGAALAAHLDRMAANARALRQQIALTTTVEQADVIEWGDAI